MSRISRSCGILAVAVAFAAPVGAQGTYKQTTPLDPANIDRSANACTDFYQFANGGWVKNNPLPAAYSRWGSFEELGEKNQAALTSILASAAKNPAAEKDPNLKMLGTFYNNCMDSAAAERYGATPVQPELTKINALSDRAAIQSEIAHLQQIGVAVAFGFGSTQDAKNSSSVIG